MEFLCCRIAGKNWKSVGQFIGDLLEGDITPHVEGEGLRLTLGHQRWDFTAPDKNLEAGPSVYLLQVDDLEELEQLRSRCEFLAFRHPGGLCRMEVDDAQRLVVVDADKNQWIFNLRH